MLVRRAADVVVVGRFESDDPDWIDSGLLRDFDTGAHGPVEAAQAAAEIVFTTVLVDSVKLFYSDRAWLDSVSTSGLTDSSVVIDSLMVPVFIVADSVFLDSALVSSRIDTLWDALGQTFSSSLSATDTTGTSVVFADSVFSDAQLFDVREHTLSGALGGTVSSRLTVIDTIWTGAPQLDSSQVFTDADSLFRWEVAPEYSTAFVPAGNYYVYGVASADSVVVQTRSDTTYNVRHSPFFQLDGRSDVTVNTGGTQVQRYYNVTWNQDTGFRADFDRDDNALISLYYSDADSFQAPGDAGALITAAADTAGDTHRFASGVAEDPDGQDDNQYVWDLWQHSSPDDGGAPSAGTPYYLYGVIEDGSTRRLVRWEDGLGNARQITFEHDPQLEIRSPLEAIAIDGRRSFTVTWEAIDVDDDASLWVLMLPLDDGTRLGEQATWAEIESSASQTWIATSSDGSLASAQPLSEDETSAFIVRPSRLLLDSQGNEAPIGRGEYYVYVVIDPTRSAAPDDTSPAVRAAGRVTLEGFGADRDEQLPAPAVELLPAVVRVSAVPQQTEFSLRPNTGAETVDVIGLFMSVDSLVSVVDQDTLTGVQPFAVDPSLQGLVLSNTASDSNGVTILGLVYFEQAGLQLDGSREFARLAVLSRGQAGTAEIHIDNDGDRRSAFYRLGEEVGAIAPEVAATIRLAVAEATLSGQIRLEGRTEHDVVATLELRDRNSFQPSHSTSVTLDTEGGFTWGPVPAGTWRLTAHVDRYLDGQFPEFRLDPGQHLTGIDPTFRDGGQEPVGFLLGGDVTGWADPDSADLSTPDNEIDELDVDFVTSFFGLTTDDTDAFAGADIDADGLIWIPDLNMVAANFGITGVEPSYRPADLGSQDEPAGVHLLVESARGRTTVTVASDTDLPVRAFGLSLAYDPVLWRFVGREEGGLRATPVVRAFRAQEGLLHLGVAAIGRGAQATATGEPMATYHFESDLVIDSSAGFALTTADLIDGANRVRSARVTSTVALPHGFALLPAFPNPFNPRTALRLEVPHDSQLSLSVYDTAGQRIRTLAAGQWLSGVHTVAWDGLDDGGRAVASGVYFARLVAPSFHAQRKMLLLR